jgi:hypothetical protein
MAAIAAKRLRATALALAQLDVLVSLADLARAQNYCRPQVAEDASLRIVADRFKVTAFVPGPDALRKASASNTGAVAASAFIHRQYQRISVAQHNPEQ